MKAVSVILFIVGMVAVALLSTAIVSWLVMLLIGMMYHTFDWPARAYGFMELVPIVFVVLLLLSVMRNASSGGD